MNKIDRRAALVVGLATPLIALPKLAGAQPLMSDSEAKETAPGVKTLPYGKHPSMIPAYKTVALRDAIYQPKSKTDTSVMMNDMICHCAEGELKLTKSGGDNFTAKKGDVWTCSKGSAESVENVGSSVAIMRIIDLLT
jgi:hypothetical protein